jgi:hypothetical protein
MGRKVSSIQGECMFAVYSFHEFRSMLFCQLRVEQQAWKRGRTGTRTQGRAERQAASSTIEVVGKGFERKSKRKATSHENTSEA